MRRHDTPVFVADVQQHVLELLGKTTNVNDCLTQIIEYVRSRVAALRLRQVDPKMLLVSQTLSRSVEEYKTLSPAARAVKQLEQVNKPRFPGQQIRFVFTVGEPGVFAWDLPEPFDLAWVDVERYVELVLRAVAAVLQPWGVKKKWLDEWVLHDWYQAYFYLSQAQKTAVNG